MPWSDVDAPTLPAARRWVLVAGTGLETGTPHADILAARAVGEQLAKHQYGLVTGGWHGVDHVVAESFLGQLAADGRDPKDYLIQVIPEDWQPRHRGGHVVRTPHGAREWLEPQKYADAVVLIGGRGGTYGTWLGALHDGIPRFPFGGTQGDAERAYRETLDLWELIPVPGITLDGFRELGRPIRSADDAQTVARHLVDPLLWQSLDAVDALSRGNVSAAASVFISYSRRDAHWVGRLRTLLRPLERRGMLSIWSDADLEPGKPWEAQLLGRIGEAHAALLLVTRNFLASNYVRTVEVPALLARMNAPDARFHVFWVLLEACEWRDAIPELGEIQAIGDVQMPVDRSPTAADEQCRLIQVVDAMARAISSHQPPESAGGPGDA